MPFMQPTYNAEPVHSKRHGPECLCNSCNRLYMMAPSFGFAMSQPVMGFEYWTGDNKPVRSKEPFKGVPEDARLDDGKFKPKHFWAFVVWNYKDTKLQILVQVGTSVLAQANQNAQSVVSLFR